MTMEMTKAERAKQLRYKRAALEEMGYDQMVSELYDIEDACAEVRWFIEQDDDTLLSALDGNDEEEYEFRMAFADVEGDANRLREAINDMPYGVDEYFDDCTVALIGNRYKTVGYDGYEEDYFHLSNYEQGLAQTEAGKRIMRMTKAEMISTIGQCMGIVLAFWNLRQRYDYLKTTFDILRNENMTLLKHIKEIEAAYEKANAAGLEYRWQPEVKAFESLLENLPEKLWVE